MSFIKVDGFGQLGELEDFHYSLVQNGKITVIGRKYVAQPTHNWGHRVAFAGTYVLTFDKDSKKWERHDFPEIFNEENAEELLFVKDGSMFLAVFTNFGAIEFKKLFKWESNSFVELNLTVPARKPLDEQFRVEFVSAFESTSDGKSVLVSGDDDGGVMIYSLNVDGDKANIEFTAHIDNEVNHLRGKPVLANVHNDKVLISYGVHGCGFRWENNKFFVFDLQSKTVKHVNVEGDELPKYAFTGPKAAVVHKKTGEWITAAGSLQLGMCGSVHYGAIWVLKNIFKDETAAPVWKELKETVCEGETVIDGLTVYTITKKHICALNLEDYFE